MDDRKYRWVLEKGDMRALYPKFNRLKAVKIVDKENEPVLPTAPPIGRLEISTDAVTCGNCSVNDPVNLNSVCVLDPLPS